MGERGVYFVCVARLNDKVVVASYARKSKVDSSGVHDMLEQPSLKGMLPGRNYSFSTSDAGATTASLKGVAWHLRCDEDQRVFIAITAVGYPQRCAVQLLSDLQKAFVARCGGQVASSSENGLSHVTSGLLSELCDRFDDPSGVDTISRTVEKVESVKLIMQDNIETVLANTVQLEHIAESAESLNDQASMFKKNAVQLRKKMWWKKLKMTLLIVFITLAVLTAIAVPIGLWIQGQQAAKDAATGGDGDGGGGGDSPAAAPPPSPAPTTAAPTAAPAL
jgi:hypothetical protein